LFGQLLAYLRALPESADKVSSKTVKVGMGLGADNPSRLAFIRARDLLDPGEHGWSIEGRSFIRVSAAFWPESGV